MKKLKDYGFSGLAAGAAALVAFAPALAASAATINAQLGASINVSSSAATHGLNQGAPAEFDDDTGARVELKTQAMPTTNIVNRADREISRRITSLDALNARVDAMARLSADEKGSLSSTISAQITALNDLKTKIAADVTANNTTSLATDVHSITASYRIFMLVLPQGAIEAAADRIFTIAGIMSDLSSKLSTRISAATAAGNTTNSSAAALADMNAKISDANAQAQAANTEVASLTPDNGSSTAMQANISALQDARTKIVAARHDLIAARADAMTIVKALAGYKVSVNATTTVTASSSASTSVQ